MRKQVEAWQRSEWTDVTAKVVIYEAFMEGKLEAHRARPVLRAKVRGVSAPYDVESFECSYVRIQGTGSHSPVQGHS